MQFGPEIKVDGKRPEWLKDDDWFMPMSAEGNWSKPYRPDEIFDFDWLSGIRLPLGDARYTNLTTHTYTVRPEDEAALLASDPLSRPTPDERAVALLKRLAKEDIRSHQSDGIQQAIYEARAIVAALEPVPSPDLLQAREIMADLYPDTADKIRSGDWDDNAVRDCLIGLRRGRQLEKEGK